MKNLKHKLSEEIKTKIKLITVNLEIIIKFKCQKTLLIHSLMVEKLILYKLNFKEVNVENVVIEDNVEQSMYSEVLVM
jgi:hypothetical protein